MVSSFHNRGFFMMGLLVLLASGCLFFIRHIAHEASVASWTHLAFVVAEYLLVTCATIGLAGMGLLAGIATYIVQTLTRPKKSDHFIPLTPHLLDLPAETIEFPPQQGEHMVSGLYIPYPGATTTILICPGYRRTVRDVLGLCRHVRRAGHNVLAFEFYGHGAIVGKRVTLGYREVNDFLGAVTYAKQRDPHTRLGAIGYSMGAAVTIIGSSLTTSVEAIVADSSFASNWSAVECAIYRTLHLSSPLPSWIMHSLYWLADGLLWLRAGYHFAQVAPVQEIHRLAPRPVLLIHGMEDSIVYPHDATLLYEAACAPKELWFIPGAEHIKGYFTDSATYAARIRDFFARHLTEAQPCMRTKATGEVVPTVPQASEKYLTNTPKWKAAKETEIRKRRLMRTLRLRYASRDTLIHSGLHRLSLAYGNLVYRLRWPIIAFWLLALLVSIPFARSVTGLLHNSGYVITGSESHAVDSLMTNKLHHPVTQILAVFQSATASVSAAPYQEQVHTFITRARSFPGVTQVIQGSTGRDGHTTFVSLGFNTDQDTVAQHLPDLQRLVASTRRAGPAQITLTGDPVVSNEIELDTQADTEYAETIALPLTLLALLIVFGTVVAGFMPLALAGVTVPVTLAIIYVIASHVETNIFIQSVASIIGLGLSIDYSLFLLRRFREELQKEGTIQSAVAQTVSTAGEAILFSGTTVVLDFAGLLFIGIEIMTSFGIGGITVASVAVLAALTLLPALLSVLGNRVNALRLPFVSRQNQPKKGLIGETARTSSSRPGFWRTWALLVMRHSLVIIVTVAALLISLGWPARTLNPGLPGVSALPQNSEARNALDTFKAQFPSENTDPIFVLVRTTDGQSILTPQNLKRLDTLSRWIAAQPHVTRILDLTHFPQSPGAPHLDQQQLFQIYTTRAYLHVPALAALVSSTTAGDTTLLTVQSDTQPNTDADHALLNRLRAIDNYAKQGLSTMVGGSRATTLDFDSTLYSNFVRALVFILGATYLLLLITFRSLLLPFKAILMNALSISASYGALVYVFQQGHFQNILGFTADGSIDRFIPVLLFCVLFGLSMDYEVFLLTRIREEWIRTGNNRNAVALGIEKTGSVITNAALLFVIVSAAFTLTSLVVTKELGLGITVSVLVDATIIRSLLVPATMQLMGRWNWWLPGYDRLSRKRRKAKQATARPVLVALRRAGRTFITQQPEYAAQESSRPTLQATYEGQETIPASRRRQSAPLL